MKIDSNRRSVDLDPRAAQFYENPYPAYQELRQKVPAFKWQQYGYWCFAGHEDVNTLLRDRRFGRQILHVATREELRLAELEAVRAKPPEAVKLMPLLKKLGIGRNRHFMEQPPYGIRDERLRAQISTAMLSGDSAAAGLPGNPWYSLAEMHGLAADVRRQLSQVTAPCLVAHASEDDIASLKNAELVMRQVSAPAELLLLKDSYHMITIDKERRTLIERSAAFFDNIAAADTLQHVVAA